MDFSVIFQLKTKKFWWMDVILYFVLSLFLATLLSYFIFLIKNNLQREEIQKVMISFQTVGTTQQKQEEKEVLNYQKKINDFSSLLKNHQFTSNVFSFLEAQTIPNVWYKQFNLNAKNSEVQISGEAEDMDALARQIAVFESSNNQKYVKSFGTLNSTTAQSSRIDFSTNLVMNKTIFDYISSLVPTNQVIDSDNANTSTPANNSNPSAGTETGTSSTVTPTTNNPDNSNSGIPAVKSNEKAITSFRLSLKPEVLGVIDQKNYTITLTVPYGTNLKNLISSIIVSPGATISPASKVSQDFTNPVTYRVTAQDGTMQAYQVKVVVTAPLQEVQAPVETGPSALTILMYLGVGVFIIAGIILLVWKKIFSKPKGNNQTYAN